MQKELTTQIQTDKFYSPVELAKILGVNNKTITNAIKSWNLVASNIWTSERRANYKINWLSILAWLDNYSDLEVLEKFLEFYINSNWFKETKQFINTYFNKKENYDNK